MTTAAVRERGILFSGAMVRAILDGRKTVTRRVVKLPRWSTGDWGDFDTDGREAEVVCANTGCFATIPCPYGAPGDRLWVRETFALADDHDPDRYLNPGGVFYQATHSEGDLSVRWKPSIHMPRWASRITLEVTGVRVERLQEITEADAVAEGIQRPEEITNEEADVWPGAERALFNGMNQPRDVFCRIWDSLNAGREASWASNPWVWVVEFRRLSGSEVQRG